MRVFVASALVVLLGCGAESESAPANPRHELTRRRGS
jgi:hypothetical protein